MLKKLHEFNLPLATFIISVVVFMLAGATFAVTEVTTQRDRSTQTQSQVNGDQAMIYAVCSAFHRRDLIYAGKWKSVTTIENNYKPKKGSDNAEYHAERRGALLQAAKTDQQIVNFDCAADMLRAYKSGSQVQSFGSHREITK